MTVNETHIFSPALVNEARVGYNRININFDPNVVVNPADLGINVGDQRCRSRCRRSRSPAWA